MKEIKPHYYDKFYCKADRCIHSCCVGWEIDIDEETLDRYRSVQGEFGDRLRAGIDFDEGCFILDENERCPFLNQKGLCDIILRFGENALCGICSDHPRFRNFFSEITETGLGLCCEEAAELILTDKEPFSLKGEELYADDDEKIFFEIRGKLFELAQDSTFTLEKRMDNILSFIGAEIPILTDEQMLKLLLSLEILDEKWNEKLNVLKSGQALSGTDDKIFERLLVYFIFRHTADSVYDGLLAERTGFCVLCVKILQRLCDGLNNLPEIIETVRMFSAEIEYSSENTNALINECSQK